MKFSDDVARIPSVIIVVVLLCLPICCSQTVTTCKLGKCIYALACPIMRPALSLHMEKSSNEVIDIIKQHRCGNRESRSVCCTDLAADLISHNVLVNFTDENSTVALAQLMTGLCGLSSGSDRIINGETAFLFEFPWMALLEFNTTMGSSFLCGGSLISDRYVLTAAHCLILPNTYLINVRLGEYDTSTDRDCETFGNSEDCAPPVQNYGVEDVVIHEDFKRELFLNDIALIRLKQKVVYGDRIFPICLPILEELNEDFDSAEIAGWGLTASGIAAAVLQKAFVPVLSNEFCEKLFGRTLLSSHLCAGGNRGVDTCKGDSGGPLFTRAHRNRFYGFVQYGILSAGGPVCGANNTLPSIYTNVSHYVPWIARNMSP